MNKWFRMVCISKKQYEGWIVTLIEFKFHYIPNPSGLEPIFNLKIIVLRFRTI